jgi:hypothetical protein
MSRNKNKGTGLRYVSTKDPMLIPRYLLEQVKPQEFSIDRFYALSKMFSNNPFNFIGLFVDRQNVTKGFMWSTYNPLLDNLFINILSVDKEYHNRGIMKEAVGIATNIMKKIGSHGNIYGKTTRPRACFKYGFKPVEYTNIVFEVNHE